jgi:hypothetical protein
MARALETPNKGDTTVTNFLTFVPMVISIAVAVFLIALAVRLVRAVERIADKLG